MRTLMSTRLIAASLLVASGPGWTQTDPIATPGADQAATLDAVVVTGTRARDRSVLESTAPIDVLTGADLRKAGAAGGGLGAALQTLLPSFNFPRQSNSGGADHVRAAQLRGLAPDQVLVLVNGKRRHVSALVNTDSKIGKGTTPVDFNAIALSAVRRIEVLRDGAGAQYGSDAVAGVVNVILDDAPEGGAWEASYGLHRTDLEPIHRNVTDGQTGQLSATVGTGLGDEGFLRVGVEYRQRAATNRAGFDQIPYFEAQTPDNLAMAGQRNYQLGDGATKNINGWFNSELAFGANGNIYAFGTYHQAATEGANYFRYPDSAGNWRQIYPEGYRPISLGDNLDTSLVIGVRGLWGEWDYDASLNYGRNAFTYRLKQSLNASLGPGSPTQFKTGDYQFQQGLLNVDLSRAFGAHQIAVGAELRREDYQTGAGDPASHAAGPYIDRPTGSQAGGGLTPQDQADLGRRIASVYASASSTFGETLTTDAALRYEYYDGFGGQPTGKLAARYEFAPAFALRGAVSSNFRAPALSQIGYEATSTGYDAAGRLLQGRLLSVNNPIARALGARDLDPETSLNLSLGLTSRIGERFDMSLDLFQIDIDNRVALSEDISSDALTALVEREFGVRGVQSASFFVNAADTRTRGAELVANWRHILGAGELLLTGAYSYAQTELRNIVATPAQLLVMDPDYALFGLEEGNTLTDAAPRTRAQFSTNWRSDRWSLLARLSRHGSTTRIFDFGGGYIPRQTYGAELQFDAEADYQITPRWSVALGGQNLTDRYPDRSNPDISYFGNLPYDVLSPIGINGAYYYTRLRYAFH